MTTHPSKKPSGAREESEARERGITKSRAEVIEEMVPQWEKAMDDIVTALTKCAAVFCQHERREHQDSCGCLHPSCECDTFITPGPSLLPEEAKPAEDRSMRVIPLADRALHVLMTEEDFEVRRAAVKLINIAEKHWPKSRAKAARSEQEETK